jgi:hypothetical protein
LQGQDREIHESTDVSLGILTIGLWDPGTIVITGKGFTMNVAGNIADIL